MKINNIVTIPTIALIAGLIAFNTIPQSFAQDNSQYLNFRNNKYLVVGTGNLGLTNELNSFNYTKILDNWVNTPVIDEFNIEQNLTNKLTAIDYIHGATEGNVSFNKYTKQWVLTNNFVSHLEPSGSERNIDNLGQYNTGVTSTNCYINRPQDTELNPLCSQSIKNKGLSENEVGGYDIDKKRNFFYDTKLTLLLSNYKSLTIKKYAKELIKSIYEQGLKKQNTTIKMFYIDQINQLGLEGVKKLLVLEKKYLEYTRDNLFSVLKQLKVINGDNIYRTTWGAEYKLNNAPTDIVRLILSRTQYFNALNSDTEYDSKQQWIIDIAKNNNINQSQIMSGDVIRRLTLLPQSKQEFDDMQKDAANMNATLRNIFE